MPIFPVPDSITSRLRRSTDRATTPAQPLPTIPEGERHGYLLRMAGEMRRKGHSVEAIRAALIAESDARFSPPEDADEIEKIVHSAVEWPPSAPNPAGIATGAPLSDEGNAQRLVTEYGEQVRYDSMHESWRRWDGKRWTLDVKKEVEWLARQTVQHIRQVADQESDEQTKTAIRKWASKSESAGRMEAMLKLARSTPGMVLTERELDADPLLFNCANGVLDLNTCELLHHDSSRPIAKLCPTSYDPYAPPPALWQAYLDRFLPDKDDQEWLQVLAGYCLSGLTSEQAFWVLWGPGGSGKSSALDILREVIGSDYGQVAPSTLLMEKRPGQATNDTATLHGARIVTHGDLPKGALDIDLLKALTGEGTVRARHLYANSFEFTPQCKLIISVNTRPVLNETTEAVWRRFRLHNFTVRITEAERIKDYARKVVAQEATSILRWMVEGWKRYQELGCVPIPPSAREAVKHYRADVDVLAQFLADRCEKANDVWCRFSELSTAFQTWATDAGLSLRRYSRGWLREELHSRNLQIVVEDGAQRVHGIALHGSAGRSIDLEA